MDKLNRLKSEALQSTKFQGHVMNQWIERNHSWYCECLKCGRSVRVELTPAPNSTDISGKAVALSCE